MKLKSKQTHVTSAEVEQHRQPHLRSGPIEAYREHNSAERHRATAGHFDFSVPAYRNLMNAIQPMGLFF